MFAENKNYFRMVTQNTYLIYVMSVLTQGNRLALSPSCLGFSRFSRCFFVMTVFVVHETLGAHF